MTARHAAILLLSSLLVAHAHTVRHHARHNQARADRTLEDAISTFEACCDLVDDARALTGEWTVAA